MEEPDGDLSSDEIDGLENSSSDEEDETPKGSGRDTLTPKESKKAPVLKKVPNPKSLG